MKKIALVLSLCVSLFLIIGCTSTTDTTTTTTSADTTTTTTTTTTSTSTSTTSGDTTTTTTTSTTTTSGATTTTTTSGNTTTSTSTTSTTTSTAAGATVSISGTLNEGLLYGAGAFDVRAYGGELDGFSIVAIENGTGQTFFASSDASGIFTLEVSALGSYEISLIDDESNYFGPIIMAGDSASNEVVMGIIPADDFDLGNISVDLANGAAQPTDEPTAMLNSDDTAIATDGIPDGAGNNGTTVLIGEDNEDSGADTDNDGIPNLFDGDEDNDGIRNGISVESSTTDVVSDVIESAHLSMNIWSSHSATLDAASELNLRLIAYIVSGQEDNVSSVRVINPPTSIRNTARQMYGSLGTLQETYTEQLWSEEGFKLYKTLLGDSAAYVVMVVPHSLPQLGDTFFVEVTLTDSSTEIHPLTVPYVLTDVSRVIEYNGTSALTNEGTMANPIGFSASSLEVVWTKPRYEDGTVIDGLSHSISYGTGEVVSSSNVEVDVTDTGGDTLTYTITTDAVATYNITPIAETADNQRNGQIIRFIKE